MREGGGGGASKGVGRYLEKHTKLYTHHLTTDLVTGGAESNHTHLVLLYSSHEYKVVTPTLTTLHLCFASLTPTWGEVQHSYK